MKAEPHDTQKELDDSWESYKQREAELQRRQDEAWEAEKVRNAAIMRHLEAQEREHERAEEARKVYRDHVDYINEQTTRSADAAIRAAEALEWVAASLDRIATNLNAK